MSNLNVRGDKQAKLLVESCNLLDAMIMGLAQQTRPEPMRQPHAIPQQQRPPLTVAKD